jgi:hypothetical protein
MFLSFLHSRKFSEISPPRRGGRGAGEFETKNLCDLCASAVTPVLLTFGCGFAALCLHGDNFFSRKAPRNDSLRRSAGDQELRRREEV